MDLGAMQIPLIFVTFFLVASLILGLVYKLGMKEKSYEEALAEQRHSSQSLLGIKQKPKDKKIKKSTKKTKEKDPDDKKIVDKPEAKSILKLDKHDDDVSQEPKPKIKFNKVVQKSNEDVNSEVEFAQPPKQASAEKLVLAKKTETNKVALKEKINAIKKEEQPKKEIVKEKAVNIKKEQIKRETVRDKSGNKKEETVKEKVNIILKSDDQPFKETEKKIEPVKKDDTFLFNEAHGTEDHLQEIADDKLANNKQVKWNTNQNKEKKDVEERSTVVTKAPLANGYIINPTKDKKKKKNELNALQQLTAAPGGPGMALILNMVHKAELSHADIQILIDLLLNKQFDRTSVLDDWSEGKSDPVQKLKKQLAEKEKALVDEQESSAAIQLKLKEVRNDQLAEKSSLNQKIKALDEQLQNQQMEIIASNNRYHAQGQQLQQLQVQLNDERINLHNLREELGAVQMQRQQLEMHIAQESEVMIAQLRADVQELSERNDQLLIQFNHIQKVATDNEASYVGQLNNMTQELNEKSRQYEEIGNELANANEMLYRRESELKMEIDQLNTAMQQQDEEIRKIEQDRENLLEELSNLKKQNNISSKVITQLKCDIEKLQEEKSQNEASMENNKINQTEVLNLKNELASIKSQLEENEKKFKTEVENKSNLMSRLESELEEQKTKNKELRNKNYKIMEALNAAESRINNVQTEYANREKDSLENKAMDIESQKKFLSRLLPEVNGLGDIPSERWEEECLKVVSNYLERLKKPAASSDSTENLQARIEHYQNAIENTEGMLGKLQAYVDQEEISWKAQIKSKDLELEALKEKLEKSQNLENINGSSAEGQ